MLRPYKNDAGDVVGQGRTDVRPYRLILAFIPPLTFAGYILLAGLTVGDPLAYFKTYASVWNRTAGTPIQAFTVYFSGQTVSWYGAPLSRIDLIMTLFYLPFGKLFHIVQRPASIGVELYQRHSREMEQAVCPRCGTMFVGKLWIDDLKKVVDDLGFDYRMPDGHTLQDYCPRCKRVMRGLAYANLPSVREPVFIGARAEDGTVVDRRGEL